MARPKRPMSRRQFLGLAGLGAAAAGLGAGCGRVPLTPTRSASQAQAATLKIVQWGHFVPAYKDWFVAYTQEWGARQGATVTVDFVGLEAMPVLAAGEAAAQAGHDLCSFSSSPASFEEELLDLTDIVMQVESKVGPMTGMARGFTYNQKTQKQFGLSDFWAPGTVIWRQDLWEQAEPGSAPETWDDLLRVGRKLKALGAPLGLGMSADLDSNMTLRALLYAYGASEQTKDGQVAINSPAAVEAVKMGTALFKETMTPEVLAWASASNNQYIAGGAGSLVINAVSALRSIEKANPDLARNLQLARYPAGPAGRLGPTNVVGIYTIWKFSPSIDLAKQFLVDLITNYAPAFAKSELYNLPSFPGTVPDLKNQLSRDAASDPPGKYLVLDGADQWVTNFGQPGTDNAAINEVMSAYIVPKMFALAAREVLTAEAAVQWAEKQMRPIFEKWQKKGMI